MGMQTGSILPSTDSDVVKQTLPSSANDRSFSHPISSTAQFHIDEDHVRPGLARK